MAMDGVDMRIENEQTHYRARFEMCPYATTTPAIVEAFRSIYKWIYTKESIRSGSNLFNRMRGLEAQERFLKGSFSYPSGYVGGLNLSNETALSTNSLMNKRRPRIPDAWALEYDEPDGYQPFRHWHTRIGLSTTADGTCIVNLTVGYYMLPSYVGRKIADPKPNIPRLMREIVSLSEYQCNVGETTIEAAAVHLTAPTFESDFAANLTSPDRELPLILVVSDNEGNYSIGDVDKFASSLLGMANVYALDYRDTDLKSALFRLFLRDTPAYRYNCAKGSIRLYRPGIDLEDASASVNHRYFSWEKVSCDFQNAEDFSEMLNRSLSRSFIKSDADVVGIDDIDLLRNARELEERKRKHRSSAQSSPYAINHIERADLVRPVL